MKAELPAQDAFKDAMRREGRVCYRCAAPIANAAILRHDWELQLYGEDRGRRNLVISLQCPCGRRIRMVWKLAPPTEGVGN